MSKYKSDQEIIDGLKKENEMLSDENKDLSSKIKFRDMTKDDLIDEIKKISGKRIFIDALFKMNWSELEDFYNFLKELNSPKTNNK